MEILTEAKLNSTAFDVLGKELAFSNADCNYTLPDRTVIFNGSTALDNGTFYGEALDMSAYALPFSSGNNVVNFITKTIWLTLSDCTDHSGLHCETGFTSMTYESLAGYTTLFEVDSV